MEGWIKLHRKLLTWQWFTNGNTLRLFIYLILAANHKKGKWQGVDIKPGQIVTGIHQLSIKTGLTERQTRTSLNHLKSTGELAIKTTNKNSIITICNYESYQSLEIKNDKQNDKQKVSQTTNKRQTNDNKQEYKNNNNNKEERKSDSSKILNRLITTY